MKSLCDDGASAYSTVTHILFECTRNNTACTLYVCMIQVVDDDDAAKVHASCMHEMTTDRVVVTTRSSTAELPLKHDTSLRSSRFKSLSPQTHLNF